MSTRRARIKAVAALPPRRKNVDNADNKTKQEEKTEDEIKPPSESSTDKTPRDQVSDSFALEHTKKGHQSPTKRRLSVDKSALEQANKSLRSPTKRRLSIDKSKGVEDEPNTPRTRRSSTLESPRIRQSATKTPKRSISVDKNLSSTELIAQQEQPSLKVQKTASVENFDTEDSVTKDLSSKPAKEKVVSNQILKGLLNAAERPPRNVQLHSSLTRTLSNISLAKDQEDEKSSSKSSQSDSDIETKGPSAVPFFASPRGRASPRRPSPIVRTPIIEVDLVAEKCIAPHKGPNSVREKNYMQKHAEDVNKKFANKEVEVIIEKILETDEFKKINDPKNDEYAIEPLPETSTVMDGIVPLQSVSKAPKPLDLLKNEIISENAEVLFDPIVPLPSPSKVRQKLRPAPRLGPRRNSFQQGSASESEDDNRRLHGRPPTPATPARQRNDSHTSLATSIVPRDVTRVRNDSMCSIVSQAPSHTTAVGSPLREREKTHNSRSRREEMTARRNAAMRKREKDVERDKLTMYDLIFYNPKDNPIIPDQDEINAKEANKKEEEERIADAGKPGPISAMDVDDSDSEPAAPVAVPQIKLGPNGEIVLDEQSLVVNQSEQRKIATSVVREGSWGAAASRAYRRTARSAPWSDAETVRFYRALAAMGTDFTLMQPLFPDRTRRDIKLKFKREERTNLAQVDMALRSRSEFDPIRLEKEFTQERKIAVEAEKQAKEKLEREKEQERERERERRRLGVRQSKSSKVLGDSAMPQTFGQGTKTPCTLDEYVQFQEERKRKARQLKSNKKRKPVEEFAPSSVTSMKAVVVPKAPSPARAPTPTLATLTLLNRNSQLRQIAPKKPTPPSEMATITKEVPLPVIPPNIEKGSLVVLTVNDPQSPSRKMLQTYISQGPGNLAPVSLPPNLLSSVVGFMKKTNSPSSTVVGSPTVRAERPKPPNQSPKERKNSYTITQL